MGFFKNMKDEAGKKAGKAIGNAVFGSLGADQTVNVNARGGGSTSDADYEKRALERMRIEQANKEQRDIQLQDIVTVTFDADNPNSIIQVLTVIAAQIDAWIKNPGKFKRHLEAATSKFDMGIAILRSSDPSNAMLTYFMDKKRDWNNLSNSISQKKKRNLIIKITCFVVSSLITIIGFATGPEGGVILVGILLIIVSIVLAAAWGNNNSDDD